MIILHNNQGASGRACYVELTKLRRTFNSLAQLVSRFTMSGEVFGDWWV